MCINFSHSICLATQWNHNRSNYLHRWVKFPKIVLTYWQQIKYIFPSSYAYLLKASWKITILPCASVSSVKYQWWYHMATCLELYRETKEMVHTNILLFLYLTHLTHLIQISFLLSFHEPPIHPPRKNYFLYIYFLNVP